MSPHTVKVQICGSLYQTRQLWTLTLSSLSLLMVIFASMRWLLRTMISPRRALFSSSWWWDCHTEERTILLGVIGKSREEYEGGKVGRKRARRQRERRSVCSQCQQQVLIKRRLKLPAFISYQLLWELKTRGKIIAGRDRPNLSSVNAVKKRKKENKK